MKTSIKYSKYVASLILGLLLLAWLFTPSFVTLMVQAQKEQGPKPDGDTRPSPTEVTAIPYTGQPPKVSGGGGPHFGATVDAGFETEPNDTAGTANPLNGRDVKIKANIFQNGDIDFFSFTANAGDRVYAATQTSLSANGSTDSQLDILDTDGTTSLEFDDDNGVFGGLSSSIAGTMIPASGTYFIRVKHFSVTNQLRPYDLYVKIQSGAPVAEIEPNDSLPGQALPASGWVSGSTSSTTDIDFYSLSLTAGQTVFISLDLDPERDTVEWNGQTGIGVFNGSVLVGNDAGTTGPDSEAFFMTVKDTGTYSIIVNLPTGGTTFGTYHLSVSALPAPPTCTTYTSTDVLKTIGPGTGTTTSTLNVPTNSRIEKLQVFINLTHANMPDLDVSLTAPDGNTVGLFTDIGASSQTAMNLTLDDDAGVPIGNFTVVSGMIYQPELAYRLNWFRGQQTQGTWTLTISDDLAANGGTLNSWGIIVCEEAPICANQSVIYSSDFEANDGGFTHMGTADEWERGLPTAAPITTANSGVNCWKTDLDNTYNASCNQDLFSPTIDLTSQTGQIVFNWAQKFQMESASFDHYFVEVQEVGGGGMTRKVYEWYDATMTNTEGSPTVTTQEAAGWGLYQADISDFAGKMIRLRFHLDSDTTVQLGGVAIDDVTVAACQVACMLTCPENQEASNDPGQCGAVVNFPAPETTGDCGAIFCSPPSGSFFPVGTTTVTCEEMIVERPSKGGREINGVGGGGASCSFTVTVNDAEAPVVTCPNNITQSNDADQCGAVVNFEATATDNCDGTITPVCSPAAGSFFPVGTTTVTCMATDMAGNTGSCSFTVTVNDTQAPVITCPGNIITKTVNPNDGCVPVNFVVTATDNCPGVTVQCVNAANPQQIITSGDCFSSATTCTQVVCTATDAAGNVASCSFSVAVYDICLEDDGRTTSRELIWNSFTGDYIFCCDGLVLCGKGTVKKKGSTYTLQHFTLDRRIESIVSTAQRKGNASLQFLPGADACTIQDRDISNNFFDCALFATCACEGSNPAVASGRK